MRRKSFEGLVDASGVAGRVEVHQQPPDDREDDRGQLGATDDRGTTAVRQREFATRAGRVVEIDAGHHPFLSQPEVVRDLIVGL